MPDYYDFAVRYCVFNRLANHPPKAGKSIGKCENEQKKSFEGIGFGRLVDIAIVCGFGYFYNSQIIFNR